MMIAALKLTEKPWMDQYTKEDILMSIDPINTVDTINMGSELMRDGYWSTKFITYIVTSPTNNTQELKELFSVCMAISEACPDLSKVFWVKEGEKFIVSYPFLTDKDSASNFISIKSELIRFTQFQMISGKSRDQIIKDIKMYRGLLVVISKCNTEFAGRTFVRR